MLIFGTIGVFVRYIPLPSSAVALARALIGKEIGDIAEYLAPSGKKSYEIIEVKWL